MRKRIENKKELTRVLIVDDHPVFREGLAGVLAREPDLFVAGQANHARQAADAIERLKPDLILLDLSLPDKSGLEFIKDLRALHPNVPVLVLSMHDETLYAERLLGRFAGRRLVSTIAVLHQIVNGDEAALELLLLPWADGLFVGEAFEHGEEQIAEAAAVLVGQAEFGLGQEAEKELGPKVRVRCLLYRNSAALLLNCFCVGAPT